ncbi:L-histidine N(alpha)-methyltransferase [Bremerella sp. JC817]|uniref:L-histidine N(alpha)-methyltransferase n=1 Tax=Bremerella sp. JC817 TaxID=3231756 RepID=UPI00345A3FC0
MILPRSDSGRHHSTTLNRSSARDTFLEDALSGLRNQPKQLPCKYFYDQRGSRLFDAICETDDYYVTRTETSIMQHHADEMGECLGRDVMLIEFGSGSSLKTRFLLDHLLDPAAYVPVDISREHLHSSADRIRSEYTDLEVLPVCADFTRPFSLPSSDRPASHQAVYFPGSTIGNFQPAEAQKLLSNIAQLCGQQGGLLIGIDLKKDPEVLEKAYNDSDGVTAEFNLNLLRRMRNELDAKIDLNAFDHHAFYNPAKSRVEMHLRSRIDQAIHLGDESVRLKAGELIHTENSHKYSIDGFAKMASEVGWTLRRSWTDANRYFAVLHLVVL